MTDKELKKLGRSDLLEILVGQSQEIDSLKEELSNLRAEIEKREITIKSAGSIAEASLKINGVFEAAQRAAQQYVDNVRRLDSEHGTFVEAQRRRIEATIGEASARADEIIKSAQKEADRLIAEARDSAGIEAEKIIAEAMEAARNVKPEDVAVADEKDAEVQTIASDGSDDISEISENDPEKDDSAVSEDAAQPEQSADKNGSGARTGRKKKKRR